MCYICDDRRTLLKARGYTLSCVLENKKNRYEAWMKESSDKKENSVFFTHLQYSETTPNDTIFINREFDGMNKQDLEEIKESVKKVN